VQIGFLGLAGRGEAPDRQGHLSFLPALHLQRTFRLQRQVGISEPQLNEELKTAYPCLGTYVNTFVSTLLSIDCLQAKDNWTLTQALMAVQLDWHAAPPKQTSFNQWCSAADMPYGQEQLVCKVKPQSNKVGSGIAMRESELDLNDMCYLIDLVSCLRDHSGCRTACRS